MTQSTLSKHGRTKANGADFTAPVTRERLYWAAAREVRGTEAQLSSWFLEVLNGFKCQDKSTPIDAVLNLAYNERKSTATDLKMILVGDAGVRKSRVCQDSKGWKLEHLAFFSRNNLPWPVENPATYSSRSVVCLGGLLPREVDATLFVDQMFAPKGDLEWLDINLCLTRLLGSSVDESGRVKADAAGPWRLKAPTQVGSGKVLIRYPLANLPEACEHPGKSHFIRVLEPYEAFRLMGWSDHFWSLSHADPLFDDNGEDVSNCPTVERAEHLHKLAGNAYSIYHFVPWLCSLLSAFGRFAKTADEEPPADDASDHDKESVDLFIDLPSSPGSG